MKPKLNRCLALAFVGGAACIYAASTPLDRVAAEQRELSVLLAKASPSSFGTNSPDLSRRDDNFSPYLTRAENERFVQLLRDAEISAAVTREQALAAVKQRQLDENLPGFQYNALMDLVNRRWPHDEAVIGFYRDALARRGEVAISDLFSPTPGIWDDSLLEPVIAVIEKAGKPNQVHWNVVDHALAVLDRHHSVWETNTAIPPRLSKAVLAMFPSLTNTAVSGPRPGEQMWCYALQMLAKTHDSEMIPVLRPFLTNKGMAGDGCYWIVEANPPLRACDRAAITIRQLLGERNSVEPIGMPGLPYWNVRESYPKWDEWDGKIAELQQQLDALGSALHFICTNHLDTAQQMMTTPEAIQRIPGEGEGASAWRVSWKHKIPVGAAAIKGGQLLIIVHDSGKVEKGFSE